MKKFFIYLLLGLLSLIFSACGSKDQQVSQLIVEDAQKSVVEKGGRPTDEKKIALVMKTLTNPFFVEMEKGARKAEQELGINLIVKCGAKETSIDQQINIVQELIGDQVDAIVIAPGSSTELIPVLMQAQKAGITIINLDNRIDPIAAQDYGLLKIPFISADNEEGAYLSAKYITQQIKRPTEAAIIEGILGADNGQQRKKGALKAFNENKNIRVVALETANWKIDEAYKVTADIFKRNPHIRAIFCANDMMALGTLQYLQEKGITNVLVAGYDALAEAKKAILDGKLAVTIDQQPAKQGYLGVKYALAVIEGKKVPLETMVPIKLIDRGVLKK